MLVTCSTCPRRRIRAPTEEEGGGPVKGVVRSRGPFRRRPARRGDPIPPLVRAVSATFTASGPTLEHDQEGARAPIADGEDPEVRVRGGRAVSPVAVVVGATSRAAANASATNPSAIRTVYEEIYSLVVNTTQRAVGLRYLHTME